jgi:hypothetical protein
VREKRRSWLFVKK